MIMISSVMDRSLKKAILLVEVRSVGSKKVRSDCLLALYVVYLLCLLRVIGTESDNFVDCLDAD